MRKRQRFLYTPTFVSSFNTRSVLTHTDFLSHCLKCKVKPAHNVRQILTACSSSSLSSSPPPPPSFSVSPVLRPAPQPTYEDKELKKEAERRVLEPCILVGVQVTTDKVNQRNSNNTTTTTPRIYDLESSLSELEELCKTAGLRPVATVTQTLPIPDPSTYIKSGKVNEIKSMLQSMNNCCTVIFDMELTPSQLRNIENKLSNYPDNVISVIDRTALILDIFSQHAISKEGKLQVELALYKYRLPRLTKLWTHLEKQSSSKNVGLGIGLRGPGETQLEIDRRLILTKINRLQKQIENIKQHRNRLKDGRTKKFGSNGIPLISIIGYTNVGKSTLLNCLVGKYQVLAENKLFATVDPITRKVHLNHLNFNPNFLITDTVGFIQNLPTLLIAAFRATLEQIQDADLLVHVVDGSVDKQIIEWQIKAVENVLSDIDVNNKPIIIVLNKMDKVSEVDQDIKRLVHGLHTNNNVISVVHTSLINGNGIDDVGIAIEQGIRDTLIVVHVMIPWDKGDIKSDIHRHGCVLDEDYLDHGIQIMAKVPGWMLKKLRAYVVDDEFSDELEEFVYNEDGEHAQKEGDSEADELAKWKDLAKKRHVPRN